MITNTILLIIATLNLMGYICLKNKIEGATNETRAMKKDSNESVQAVAYDIKNLEEKIDKDNKDLKNRIMDPANKTVYIPLDVILKHGK